MRLILLWAHQLLTQLKTTSIQSHYHLMVEEPMRIFQNFRLDKKIFASPKNIKKFAQRFS